MAITSTYHRIDGEDYVKAKDYDNIFLKLMSANKKIEELEAQIERDKELLEIKTDEVSISEDKIPSCLCPYCGGNRSGKIPEGYEANEESLLFADEQYEDDLIEELQDRHQQDCITINQLQTTIDILVDRYATLREMRGL